MLGHQVPRGPSGVARAIDCPRGMSCYWEMLMRTLATGTGFRILAMSGCKDGYPRDAGNDKGALAESGAKVSLVKPRSAL